MTTRKLPNKFDELNARYRWIHLIPPITLLEMVLGVIAGVLSGVVMWVWSLFTSDEQKGPLRLWGSMVPLFGWTMPFFLFSEGKSYHKNKKAS